MNDMREAVARAACRSPSGASGAARARLRATEGRPLFTADWDRTLFLHYAVPPGLLQPFVPFPLDVRGGGAFVSLVAFTMRGLRPALGGPLTSWATRPVATHGFLNVRTYVRHMGEPGIYFLAEWLPNLLSTWMGPRLFGLPYRWGRLDYRHEHERGALAGEVVPRDAAGRLVYRAGWPRPPAFAPCAAGTLTEFLCERYTAFTSRRGRTRLFRIWHPPWPLAEVEAEVPDASLVLATGEWFRGARPAGAHYSPGVRGVWIGRPQAA